MPNRSVCGWRRPPRRRGDIHGRRTRARAAVAARHAASGRRRTLRRASSASYSGSDGGARACGHELTEQRAQQPCRGARYRSGWRQAATRAFAAAAAAAVQRHMRRGCGDRALGQPQRLSGLVAGDKRSSALAVGLTAAPRRWVNDHPSDPAAHRADARGALNLLLLASWSARTAVEREPTHAGSSQELRLRRATSSSSGSACRTDTRYHDFSCSAACGFLHVDMQLACRALSVQDISRAPRLHDDNVTRYYYMPVR